MQTHRSAKDEPGERPDAQRPEPWARSVPLPAPGTIRLPRTWDAALARVHLGRKWFALLHRLDAMPARIAADELRRLVDPGRRGRPWEVEFGAALPRLCPGARRRQARLGGRRAWIYEMPPLGECREQFLRSLGERMDAVPEGLVSLVRA